MSGLHQIIAFAVAGESGLLLLAAVWSYAAGRRSGGSRDHRNAVDRLILLVTATIAAGGLIGWALLIPGPGPGDGLHVLYGVVALCTPLGGWLLGGRRATGAEPVRTRRDAWLIATAVVLIGLDARLFMTG